LQSQLANHQETETLNQNQIGEMQQTYNTMYQQIKDDEQMKSKLNEMI